MANANLHKFDSKGNLIVEQINIIRSSSGSEFPYGIETDHNHFYITYGDPVFNNVSVYVFDKKFRLVKSFPAPDPKRTQGITTNGKDLIQSQIVAAFDTTDKSGNKIRNAVSVTNISYALSFNGVDIVAARAASVNVDIREAKSFNVKRTIALGNIASGICALEDRLIIIPNTGDRMDYYDYKGNLIKSIALPTLAGTIAYRDLCQDKDYLWIISYPTTDVLPPG